jgi:hypothetical protein
MVFPLKGDRLVKRIYLAAILITAGTAGGTELVLKASKDTFGRSNERNRNNGANEYLAIAHASNIRSIVAFDLAGVTNAITGAELRFRQHKTMADQISMVVMPMVHTTNNAAWGEGLGVLGVKGQNSRPGEACYAFSAFRNVPWESAPGVPVADLSDSKLWKPAIAALNGLLWEENRWVRIPISDVALLEETRNSAAPVITFGLWGKAGKGTYFISSRNSPWPPELHLTLKEEAKK